VNFGIENVSTGAIATITSILKKVIVIL